MSRIICATLTMNIASHKLTVTMVTRCIQAQYTRMLRQYTVCLSVCLSVTLVNCVKSKTDERIELVFSHRRRSVHHT